jgi:hypothetical protein
LPQAALATINNTKHPPSEALNYIPVFIPLATQCDFFLHHRQTQGPTSAQPPNTPQNQTPEHLQQPRHLKSPLQVALSSEAIDYSTEIIHVAAHHLFFSRR